MKPSAAPTRKKRSPMRSAERLSNPAVEDGPAAEEKDIAMRTQKADRNTPPSDRIGIRWRSFKAFEAEIGLNTFARFINETRRALESAEHADAANVDK
jgi:hypothetical protein